MFNINVESRYAYSYNRDVCINTRGIILLIHEALIFTPCPQEDRT